MNENWIVALVSPRDVAVHPNFREENVSDAPRILASRMKGWEFSLTNMREEPPLIGGDAGALLKAAEEAFHPETDINAAQVELERLASNSEDLALATVACLFLAASLADAEQYERLFRKLDAMIGRFEGKRGEAESVCRVLLLLQRALRTSECTGTGLEEGRVALEIVRSINTAELGTLTLSPGIGWEAPHSWERVISLLEARALSHVATASPLSDDSSWPEEVRRESPQAQMEFIAAANGGYERYIEERFNLATKDPSVQWGGGDRVEGPIVRELIHQELTGARYVKNSRKVLGQLRLLRTEVHQSLDSLRLLRQSEDEKEFAKAAEFLRANGPLEKVQAEAIAVSRQRPVAWWRVVDLAALSQGGDLLSPSEASSAFDKLAGTLHDATLDGGGRFSMSTRTAALGVLARTASRHEDLAARIFGHVMDGPQDQLLMNAYGRALQYVDWDQVGEATLSGWREWLATGPKGVDHSSVRLAVAGGVGMPASEGASRDTGLFDIAAELNSDLRLSETSVTDERLSEVTSILTAAMEEKRSSAGRGAYAFGGLSEASLAVMLCQQRPDALQLWQAVAEFVTDPNLPRELKADALDRLAAVASKIPAETVQYLKQHSEGMLSSPSLHLSGPESGPFPAALRLCAVAGLVDDADLLSMLVDLTSDEAPSKRLEGARTLVAIVRWGLVQPWTFVLLVQLCRDRDATVRAHAGLALARASTLGRGDFHALVEEITLSLLRENAVLVPLFAARGIGEAREARDVAIAASVRAELRRLAVESMSFAVREAASAALASSNRANVSRRRRSTRR